MLRRVDAVIGVPH
ncbi:Protein of unknown function [Propionibacterium freudenreichii]|uniref:Uncharacterized protein n=1 Tax=Propionibacterium freudenreichii subsp. freudenreichii TaxID=66712 RepID=A0A068VNQ9_PROFF|nr:Protein of unknown function [Propionibacterium freudenreichii subsp. freudenreichii]CEG85872.1 Protein of unknown function [Propionibacterium freudenreichii]CEG89038.1 Protein of unknown function [Propionibacterium freudenreichii]CEG90545.1 Protein of unknown function [Propionibacterium freudenreichii]CEG93956.1 Protein of unknown function [Propionibacterium freudenreichii]